MEGWKRHFMYLREGQRSRKGKEEVKVKPKKEFDFIWIIFSLDITEHFNSRPVGYTCTHNVLFVCFLFDLSIITRFFAAGNMEMNMFYK